MRALGRLKPGWYVLILLLLYALVTTGGWRRDVVALRELRLEVASGAVPVAAAGVAAAPGDAELLAPASVATPSTPLAADTGLWFPVPGARVPTDDDHLPGAERAYRSGVSEGFVFWPESAGRFIVFGTPVIAVGDGRVVRVDEPYAELDRDGWDTLLEDVADGATDAELDRLRGRQVWLELGDGRVVRYGHLSGVRAGLDEGQRVARGRVIGYVGNSGTLDGVLGRTGNPRLHFEIRDGDGFVGAGLDPDGVRLLASSLFTGP
ncbi:MAG: M23 family metallopeptidase [Trueperaceae bacterium]|nr:M23 family metallopeptidase [Trueperaceae bacterium]